MTALPKIKTRIALETTAGQGSCLGNRFEQLSYVITRAREPERLCVCVDTTHLFAAGYDIRTDSSLRNALREFDRVMPQVDDRVVASSFTHSNTCSGLRAS